MNLTTLIINDHNYINFEAARILGENEIYKNYSNTLISTDHESLDHKVNCLNYDRQSQVYCNFLRTVEKRAINAIEKGAENPYIDMKDFVNIVLDVAETYSPEYFDEIDPKELDVLQKVFLSDEELVNGAVNILFTVCSGCDLVDTARIRIEAKGTREGRKVIDFNTKESKTTLSEVSDWNIGFVDIPVKNIYNEYNILIEFYTRYVEQDIDVDQIKQLMANMITEGKLQDYRTNQISFTYTCTLSWLKNLISKSRNYKDTVFTTKHILFRSEY